MTNISQGTRKSFAGQWIGAIAILMLLLMFTGQSRMSASDLNATQSKIQNGQYSARFLNPSGINRARKAPVSEAECPTGASFSEILCRGCRTHYGSTGPILVELITDRSEIIRRSYYNVWHSCTKKQRGALLEMWHEQQINPPDYKKRLKPEEIQP